MLHQSTKLTEDQVQIRYLAERNNDEFRIAKKDVYLRIKREKKFWWSAWYKVKNIFR